MEQDLVVQEQTRIVKLKNDIFDNLTGFLLTLTDQVTNSQSLKGLVETALEERINDKEEVISIGALISLLKILKDNEAANTSSILGVLKETSKVVIENNLQAPTTHSANTDLSGEEVREVKELVGFLKDLVKTEMPT